MEFGIDKTYSEVYGIINMLGEYYKNKLPQKLYNLIENERDKQYTPVYTLERAIENQNIEKRSMAMVMLLHLNYWCETENEKQQIKAILEKNRVEVSEKYNIDNVFKRRIEQNEMLRENQREEVSEQTALVEYREPFIQKIKRIIYNLFHHNKI